MSVLVNGLLARVSGVLAGVDRLTIHPGRVLEAVGEPTGEPFRLMAGADGLTAPPRRVLEAESGLTGPQKGLQARVDGLTIQQDRA